MKFGLSLFGTHPKSAPSVENFQQVLELTRAARDAGFDLLHAGHHFMVRDFQKFQVVPALARVAAESGNMLLSVLELLPLNHPVRVAEEIATLDAITNGRIVFTPALGYVDHDFETFNVEKRLRRGIYLESIEVIKRLWTEDDVTFNGKHFQIHDATINPKPVQQPRPPIWQPADARAGIIRAAEYGDVWLISNHHKLPDIKEQVGVYEEHLKKRDPHVSHGIGRPLMRVICIGDTRQEALDVGRGYVRDIWGKYYAQMGQAAEMDDPEDFNQRFEDLKEERFIFDTPSNAIREMERYQGELGIDLLMLNLAGDHEQKLRSLKHVGESVIPHFRSQSAR